MIYVSKTNQGFFDDQIFGAKFLLVANPDWVRPTKQENGIEVPDMEAIPELIQVPNPDCRLPEDAEPIDASAHNSLISGEIDWSGDSPVSAPARVTPEAQAKAEYEGAIDKALRDGAASWGYDSIVSAASYANSTNTRFKAEALALIRWRDETWEWASDQLGKILAGQIAMPASVESFLLGMPAMPTRPA